MKTITTLGIDLAKNSFQLHGINIEGKVVLQKKVSRSSFSAMIANMPRCTIGIEACGSSHFWARKIQEYGHEVKLMAPQYVKPYVKTNKNDRADAEAICEAVTRPNMRFVQIKKVEYQDIQSIHRVRERCIGNRTASINQIRGLLYEYGIVIAQGRHKAQNAIPVILADADNNLSQVMRELIQDIYSEVLKINEIIAKYDFKLKQIFSTNEQCKKIGKIEGIGFIVATAVIAAIGDPHQFKSGRQFSAWLGLVPKQFSTGGKEKLLGISKRGNIYVRKMLIHGTRSVINWAKKKTDKRSLWINQLLKKKGSNKTSVALANKNARIIWALLAKGQDYKIAA